MNSPLNFKVVGFTLAIFWALSVFLLGLSVSFFGYGYHWVNLLGSVYIGYGPTLFGTLVGTCWAFLDGFIGGIIFTWIYNRMAAVFA